MENKLKHELDNIIRLKSIRTVFQPIISLRDGSVLGHEALSRITCEADIKNPAELFQVAAKNNRLWDLELLCRTKALEAAYKFMIPPYSKKLFINVNPNTMHDENFKKGFTKEFLTQYNIKPDNVIFEITERSIIRDIDSFISTVEHYKSQNYKIAVDDAGSGYSGLNLISDIKPHYIKLDMKLIRNIDSDSLKFAMVKGMTEISRVSDISLIAEGIETCEEMEALIKLGVQYGQGYFIQKPSEKIMEIDESVLNNIKNINNKKNNLSNNVISNIFIKNICTYIDCACPDTMVSKVYDIFKKDDDNYGLCIVKDEIPVGIVTREKLAFRLSGQFGFSLYQNKPVSEVMDTDFLSVDGQTPISDVSLIAMSRSMNKLYDFIVVTENGKYIGTVTIKDLLRKTTEIEVSVAKHQNPLSGLPGNTVIEQKLNDAIISKDEYIVAYIDIDNFKVYNDCYGFEMGDKVIKLLADILRENIFGNDFVGHVGGDDFVVILDKYKSGGFFENITEQFEKKVLGLYTESDVRKGYICTCNRYGEPEKFPLITLTCVSLSSRTKKFNDIFELTEILADMKTKSKKRKFSKERPAVDTA